MATDLERLVVRLEAQMRTYEREMQKARSNTDRQLKAVEDRFKQTENRISAFGANALKRFTSGFSVGGVLGAVGLGGLLGGGSMIASIRAVTSELSKLSDTAGMIGIGVEELQKLRYGFEDAGVSANATDTAMRRFSRRVAEAANGSGVLHSVLQANNVALRNADGTMRSQVEILRDYANLIKNARSDQERLLLAFKGFDAEGSMMVNALRGGADGVDRMMRRAEEAGVVIDKELVQKAAAVEQKFNDITRAVGANLKLAVVEVVASVKDFVDLLNSLKFGPTGEAVPAEDVGKRVVAITREIMALEVQLEAARKREAETGWKMDQERIAGIEKRIALLREEERMLIARGQAEANKRMETPPNKPTVIPTGGGDEGGGGAESKDRFEREQERLAKRIELLKAEVATIGMGTRERERARASVELLHAAQQAGIPINDELRAKVAALADQWGVAAAEAEKAKDKFKAIQDASREFGSAVADAFKGGVLEGKNLIDVVDQLIKRLASRAIDQLFGLFFNAPTGGGTSPFLQMFGFGGARAGGGPVQGGKTYLVGEEGPELFKAPGNGTIVPNHAIGKGGQAIQASFGGATVHVHGDPSARTIGLITQALEAYDKRSMQRFSRDLREVRRRSPQMRV